MRTLLLREWPVFHALWQVGAEEGATAIRVLEALAEERVADLHSVRAVLDGFVAEGYATSEVHDEKDEDGNRTETVLYRPRVEPEDAIRAAWPPIRELMLDDGRYLDLFRDVVGGEDVE